MKIKIILLSVLLACSWFIVKPATGAGLTEAETSLKDGELTDRQLNRLMRNVSQNYQNDILREQFVSQGRFIEKARCDEVWCMFTEGEFFLRSYGYDSPVRVQSFIAFPIAIYKSDRMSGWKSNMEGYTSLFPDYEYMSDTQTGINPLMSGFRFFEKNGPLSEPRRHSFAISAEEYQPSDQGQLSVDFITDASRGPQYTGRMIISREDERVHRITLERVPFHSPNFFRWVNAESDIALAYKGNRAYLAEIETRIDRQGIEYMVAARFAEPVLHSLEYTDMDYFITQHHTINPWIPEISSLDHFESLFVADLSQIRADLEGEKSLEQQFVDNSNQPWRYSLDFDGEKQLSHSGEVVFENARKIAEEIRMILEGENR